MTSINTNIAAQTALRTLQSTNAQLDQTQSRISTGLKIGEAKDNAAYWSISTTLKSDNKAMGTVKDALALGAATVDVAYQGLNATIDVLNEIKSKITAATQDGVTKASVQAEISELQKQLKSIANSSTFSGENWLSVAATESKSVVSSFTRDANNSVSIGTVSFDTATSALYVGADDGILQKTTEATYSSTIAPTFTTPAAFESADKFTMVVTVGDETVDLVIDKSVVEKSGNRDAVIDNVAELATLLQSAVERSSLAGKFAISAGDSALNIKSSSDFTIAAVTAVKGVATAAAASTEAGEVSVATLDVSSADKIDLAAYLKIVNTAIDDVSSAASNLGAMTSRIELQQTFVSNLMDTIDKGISGLVDADMNEESTRLQALQVKQQLGVQALSIANQSAQNVLRLFQ